MTREDAKQLLPILQAFAEGKTIQVKCKTDSKALTEKWIDVRNPDLDNPRCYRIKPEPKYRPFKDAEECWQEMQKHQPFGWLQDKDCKSFKYYVLSVGEDGVVTTDYESDIRYLSYETTGPNCTFADGTPFGIKEE